MTPKEQYEARKADRKARREAAELLDRDSDALGYRMEEIFDRFATALERIADVMEAKPTHLTKERN